MNYESFIENKSASSSFKGITDPVLHARMFPHQRDLTSWALAKGRAAIFADTGLGKSCMEAVWAGNVSRRGRVLVLTPLAVAAQLVEEAALVGVEMQHVKDDTGARIVVTNYERMGGFDPADFAGIVLDESSILKAYDGRTRTAIIEGFAKTPYRLAATATPAPNDFTELGNHSEFLGVKTRAEMLAEYFVHDMDTTQEWRLKGHAVSAFWQWVASWGAVVRSPADLGYDASAYDLPPLRMHEHVVPVDYKTAHAAGMLFPANAQGLSEQRATRRATLQARVDVAAEIASKPGPCVVWCELNDEGEALTDAIPDAIEVKGADSADEKTERLAAFARGDVRVLVTKGSIAGWGLNWQHCARMIFVGASHSYEQTYQAIRRCWRFGQRLPVDVHIIRAETEQLVIDNYRRKEADAKRLGDEMASHVIGSVRAEVQHASKREWNTYNANQEQAIPSWLTESVE